ncbi:unnamed protein product [Schistosoma margrebowiei]|uniref:Uncharacterized protein n=1 Tax=Schistosoma margrebowiei TaxID=48269 RepID=A0A183MFF7_9TREM|nr:unnamed protein product [Schistosoma margrebowiei]
MKLQSINKVSKFDTTDQLRDQPSILEENFNLSSIINQSDQLVSTNDLIDLLPNNQNKINQNLNKIDNNTSISNRKCVQFLKSANSVKKNKNQWVNCINEIHKMSKETLSELAHQIEVEMDKESLKESELRLTTRGQITTKTVEKKPVKGHMNEVPKEFSSHKLINLVNNIRNQLSIMTDENAIKLQDRLEFMKQIKPEICLTKYHNIPTNGYTHIAMQSMHKMAFYNKATGELINKSNQKNELAPWYLDILTDLCDLKSEPKFITVLSKLKFYAQFNHFQQVFFFFKITIFINLHCDNNHYVLISDWLQDGILEALVRRHKSWNPICVGWRELSTLDKRRSVAQDHRLIEFRR